MPAGKSLRVETLARAVVHYSVDGWKTAQDVKSRDVGLGVHVADLTTQSLHDGQKIQFTFYWPDAGDWEGTDFVVRVGSL
jgi:glucoamylase